MSLTIRKVYLRDLATGSACWIPNPLNRYGLVKIIIGREKKNSDGKVRVFYWLDGYKYFTNAHTCGYIPDNELDFDVVDQATYEETFEVD